MKNESSKQAQKQVLRKTDASGSLSWIDKDQIAGKCLNNFLKDEPETSPLYDISSKLLRRLIIEGIEAGLTYR